MIDLLIIVDEIKIKYYKNIYILIGFKGLLTGLLVLVQYQLESIYRPMCVSTW